MRSTIRLLASVERYLETGAPTGLTGLLTHGSPRSALLYLYSTTLDKLKEFPEHSVYRQATEALTKRRMKIIESVKPAGLEQWQQRVAPLVAEHPQAIRKISLSTGGEAQYNLIWKHRDVAPVNEKYVAEGPDGEARAGILPEIQEGVRYSEEDVTRLANTLRRARASAEQVMVEIEPEPPLTREQIGEIESQISAGLIEEVIEVASAEKELAEVMFDNKVWEDLEEKPVEGQWTYHERDRHTRGTEAQQ